MKELLVGLFANKYLAKVAGPIIKVVGFVDGYKTQIACAGGFLTSLAAVVAKASPLLMDGLQYADITAIAATPEWALLLISAQQFFQRLATKKLHDAQAKAQAATIVTTASAGNATLTVLEPK